MAYKFKEIRDMDEAHLCNTISCLSENITEDRRNKCRVELAKRWLDFDNLDIKSLSEPQANNQYNLHKATSVSIDDILNKIYKIKK